MRADSQLRDSRKGDPHVPKLEAIIAHHVLCACRVVVADLFPPRLDEALLDAAPPEALIYEPAAGGAMRLVGVEFIVKASVWALHSPPPAVPALEGNLLNYVGEPNRAGAPGECRYGAPLSWHELAVPAIWATITQQT